MNHTMKKFEMNQNSITAEVEADGNLAMAKIFIAVAGLYLLVSICFVIGVFRSSQYLGSILFVISLIFFFLCWRCKRKMGKGKLLKYGLIDVFILSMYLVNVMSGYKAWMLFGLPILFTCRYYDKKFTILTGLLTEVMVIASAFSNAYLSAATRLIDLNTVSFHEPGALEYYSWLHNAVMNHGYDPNLVLSNTIRLVTFPNSLCVFLIMVGCISHIQKAQSMMSELKQNHSDILEQYKLLKSMSEIYYSVHLIDLSDNTYVPYNAKNEVRELEKLQYGADKMMRAVISETLTEQYREEALEFTDISTLAERMKGQKVIDKEFVGKRIGWFIASFICMEEGEDGCPLKVMFTSRCIDEIKQKEEKLIYASNTDELSGLYNRRAYDEMLDEIYKDGIRDDFVYLAIDINGLKVVNDSIGHKAGDELIIGASECMKQCLGKYGTLYRTGGDEFIALLYIDAQSLKMILSLFEDRINRWSGKLVDHLSLSYGYVTRKEEANISLYQMAVLADQRMYAAKEAYYRKNGVDRSGQKAAYTVLSALYSKIMVINLAKDSFQIINMDADTELFEERIPDTLSAWFSYFAECGGVHPDDRETFIKKTDFAYLNPMLTT